MTALRLKLTFIAIASLSLGPVHAHGQGLAAQFNKDEGLARHPGVLLVTDFEADTWREPEEIYYHGGSWAAPSDDHLFIDNVVVAKQYIGPMGSR